MARTTSTHKHHQNRRIRRGSQEGIRALRAHHDRKTGPKQRNRDRNRNKTLRSLCLKAHNDYRD